MWDMEAGLRRSIGGTRWTRALVVAAGLLSFFAVPVQATTDTLDQSQTLTLSFNRLALMAQTFTAGAPGAVDRVSLAADSGAGGVSLTVQLKTVDANGAPSSLPALGSTSFQGSLPGSHQFHDFFFATPVGVTAGVQYAIVVRASGQFTWYDSWTIDAYPLGHLYVGCNGCKWLTGGGYGQDFAFKTWLVSNTNRAPAIAADNGAVQVTEGTAPTNSGTFSDSDLDTVKVTASTGAVTQTGTSSGTWSWSLPASDEASTWTVTVTADDGHGLSSTATFTVAVTGVDPTAQITTDPISSPEGTPIGLIGAANSPDPVDNAAGFTYGWSVTKNGSPYASGSGSGFTFTPDDEGTFVVTLKATDDGGMSGLASQTIVGTNVSPTAKITGMSGAVPLGVLTSQETLTFGGSFADPGALDSHVVTWTFGDGAIATANYGPGGTASFGAAHAYTAAGTFNVTLTVSDDDGGVGVAKMQVVVQTPAQALGKIANSVAGISSLNAGQKNSLEAKLNAAAAAAARGDTTAAHNQVSAFLNEVQADLSTGKLSADQAAAFSAAAHAVQAALGNYNRFLAWWPLGL